MTLTSSVSSAAMASPKVSSDAVHDAVQALLKWRNSKTQSQKPQLLDEEDFVYLILTLKKIPPKGRTNPYKIPLPNSLHSDISEICLFIDDRPRSDLTKDASKKKIQSENIPISKIIKFSKLKSDYRAFEEKRKLCDSYDAFFTDRRLIPLLPRLLGKHFFKKKKIPIPLDLKHKNWKEQIRNACQSALLYLKTGTCSVLRVAKTSMEIGEIEENVMAAINGIAEKIPKKWGNVRSIHLKLLESVALPIYQTVPDMKLKIEGVKQKKEVEDSGDEKGNNNKKVSKKRGRIHEVRYMDNADEEAGRIEVVHDDEMESSELKSKKSKKGVKVKNTFAGIEADQIEVGHDDEMESAELRSKKTKKGMKVKKTISGDLVEEKKVKKSKLTTDETKHSVKQKKKSSIDKSTESVEKKERKSGVGKLKATKKMVKVSKP